LRNVTCRRPYALVVTSRALAAVVMLAVMGFPVVASAGGAQVVLGKRKLTGRYGIGWGTPHPSLIYNGGVRAARRGTSDGRTGASRRRRRTV
jgi:hypothetical protein